MNPVRAYRYDGLTSRREAVWLYFDEPGFVRVRNESLDRRYPFAEVRLAPLLGSQTRELHFTDGSLCEAEPGPVLDKLFVAAGGRAAWLLHRWESSLKYAFVALLLTGLVVWVGMEFGIPALARQAAFALPASTEQLLGDDALAALDRFIFSPTRLPAERQLKLTNIFQRMTPVDGMRYRLEFRASWRIGANAFALPSGVVVLTDELVKLARHDEEIIAILAHEIGHVSHRHTLRQALQNSISGLLIAAITGDIMSTSSFAATLPTILVQARFSRQFETEADEVAIRYLRARGISTAHFANILARLARSHHEKEGDMSDYLSTHPSTVERIQRLQNDS